MLLTETLIGFITFIINETMKKRLQHLLWVSCIILSVSCSEVIHEPQSATIVNKLPEIYPDYVNITVPPNVAPLNFALCQMPEEAVATIVCDSRKIVCKASKKKGFQWDEKDWSQLLQSAYGKKLKIRIYEKDGGEWKVYNSFYWQVSTDETDPYLIYRLIKPGYELWNRMGIYQRELGAFQQKPIIENSQTGYNCINCHTFTQNDPDKMLFHMRGMAGGTYVIDKGEIKRLDGKINDRIQSLVYPSWHPSGNFVAFSTNQTRQAFHMNDQNRIEVFDYSSDILLYDVTAHEVIETPQLFSEEAFETFPFFSPDGRTLYYCSAPTQKMPDEYKEVKYSLCSIAFDPEKRSFGTKIDTLYHGKANGKSVSFPRVSPDGKFLVFTLSEYGNFSIWHKDADLYIMNLENHTTVPLKAANSNHTESYHSWSSNGRWLVFSSRRINGLYTYPYLCHIDEDGEISKPFILPQEDAAFYKTFNYSFNIPEFSKKAINVSTREVMEISKKETIKVKVKNK